MFKLMRVYGALMWSLGKVLNTPEVVRVYIGWVHFSQLLLLLFLQICYSLFYSYNLLCHGGEGHK